MRNRSGRPATARAAFTVVIFPGASLMDIQPLAARVASFPRRLSFPRRRAPMDSRSHAYVEDRFLENDGIAVG